MNLTVRELRKLEGAPKSKFQRSLDRGLTALPFALATLLVAIYKLAPNFPKYAKNPIAYPVTNVYASFIGIAAVALLAFFVLSFFSAKAYESLLFKAPLYCAIFLVLGAYDIATL
jgi:hypothetical protein